jgi:hypothetical protein
MITLIDTIPEFTKLQQEILDVYNTYGNGKSRVNLQTTLDKVGDWHTNNDIAKTLAIENTDEVIKTLGVELEKQYTVLQPELKGSVLEYYINKHNLYRTRIMVMHPRSCYSVHRDPSIRVHIPITPNKDSWMIWPYLNQCHNLQEGNIYTVNTTELHSFFNGNDQIRIHIVSSI